MSTIACDVDLGRVHCYSETQGRVCYNSPEWPWEALLTHDRILVEIASPVDTSRATEGNDKAAQAYNRRKWAIGNAFMIGRLDFWASQNGIQDRIMVSSADRWTLQHREAIREAAAGVLGQDNHDIRACRCMLYYHRNNPERWSPIRGFLASLSKKKTK